MEKAKITILYRVILVAVCLSGIILSALDKRSDTFMGEGTSINFYTLQSNIWALALESFLLFYAVFHDRRRNDTSFNRKSKFEAFLSQRKAYPSKSTLTLVSAMNMPWNISVFKLIFTTAIMLTFLIYWFLLAPFFPLSYVFQPANLLVHGFTPILVLLDYLLFDQSFLIPKRAIFLTLIPALYYFIFTLIRAEISEVMLTFGSRYPYWFMDLDAFRVDG